MRLTAFLNTLIISVLAFRTFFIVHTFPVQANLHGEVPRFETTPCMFELPPGAIEGKDLQCGYLHVPQEYKDPEGPSIRLAVAIIKAKDPNPRSDPLIMAQGGPGGSTIHTYVTQIFSGTTSLRASRDIVLLEQRGTLYSQPSLTCPEIIDETIQTLDQDLSVEESLKAYEEAVLKCRTRLISEGINLSAFDSLENASDINSLRIALGYDQINLYGVSYGTLLALHTLQNHPEGIRSVILDAVVPPQINFILESPQSQKRAFEKLFAACSSNLDCSENYPNLEDLFWNTIAQLNEHPADIIVTDFDNGKTYPTRLNGDSFRSTIFQMLYVTEIIPFLPHVIYDGSVGKFDFLQRILSLLIIDRTMSYGMYYSVLCAEDADFTAADINLDGLPPEIAQYEKENILSFLRICQQWNVQPLGDTADLPVLSATPTLILNGEYDPITPPYFGEEAAKTLKNSYVVTFSNGGHGAAMSGKCQDQIILDFLDNPLKRPDTSCIYEEASPQFISRNNTIFLPALGKLMNLERREVVEFLALTVAILFMLGAPLIWFIVWFVRKLTGKLILPRSRPAIFFRWVAAINAILLALFLGLLTFVSFRLALNNDFIILYGLPSSTKPLFIIPPTTIIMTALMLIGVIFAWRRTYWSIWNRMYYSLLSLAACTSLLILSLWNMVGVIFK
ncbi:MAG: alpha/beta fold hydrolase [Anaerolineae bacterium]|nr:alpha/beta fold hydrolase [Anaerolineae bacterium]